MRDRLTRRGLAAPHGHLRVTGVLADHRRQQLKERLSQHVWEDHDLVFASTVGTPIEPRNLSRHFEGACQRAGLPRRRIHDLRHGTATIATSLGLEAKVVQQILGHSRLATTADVYIRTEVALLHDAAERVADALLG